MKTSVLYNLIDVNASDLKICICFYGKHTRDFVETKAETVAEIIKFSLNQ